MQIRLLEIGEKLSICLLLTKKEDLKLDFTPICSFACLDCIFASYLIIVLAFSSWYMLKFTHKSTNYIVNRAIRSSLLHINDIGSP
jgi:hypothetical protein